MEQEASNQEFHDHNHIKSPLVEKFLIAFDKGERGTALRLMDEEKVFIVDADYIAGMRDRIEHYQSANTTLEEALQEIHSERDDLLQGLHAIYNKLGFIIDAVKTGVYAKKGMRGANKIKYALSFFGFKDLTVETVNVVIAIIISVKKNLNKLTQGFPELGNKLMPGLKILEKHNIITSIDFDLNGSEEEE